MARFKAPRGTQDVLPIATPRWQYIEGKFREICALYGFREIRTPTFEETELFTRTTGETTDIVTKEMYTFTDRGGRSITLRPEGTAPAVRAYLEHNIGADLPVAKLYYVGRIFRYERPQAGRYREHNQFGVEMIGSGEPSADVEVISLAHQFLSSLGLSGIELRLNSLGGPEDRPVYREALRKYAEPFVSELCPECQVRYEKNPLRMLDCKVERCRELLRDAPGPAEFLCDECRAHFETVQRSLEGLGISFVLDPRLVRGLDYYTRTVFVFQTPLLGAQNEVCGGGRYDSMVEELGGPPTPALGFGLGVERLLLTLERLNIELPAEPKPKVFVAAIGSEARAAAVKLLADLRRYGIASESDFTGRSLKSQMKLADKLGAEYVMIIGEDEVKQSVVTVRDMAAKEQRQVGMDKVAEALELDRVAGIADNSHA
ncbi:MAG: histidine--tRNA ligase [Armatimonadetes bacterium]|nr:histidine--tRNA ligase [Armatimonadota bacterium]